MWTSGTVDIPCTASVTTAATPTITATAAVPGITTTTTGTSCHPALNISKQYVCLRAGKACRQARWPLASYPGRLSLLLS